MATSFILRSPYLPANRSVYRLDAPSAVAWFQKIWPLLQRQNITRGRLLNVENLHGFAGLAEQVRAGEIAAPETCEDLQAIWASAHPVLARSLLRF